MRTTQKSVEQIILDRRSHRESYDLDQAIDRSLLERILRCGLAAPSSKHAQPWRFHIVEDRGVMVRIADAAATAPGVDTYVPRDPINGLPRPDWTSTVRESAAVLARVPVAIFVENLGPFSRGRATLAKGIQEGRTDSLVGYTFEVLGLGAAIENIFLAANSFGIQCAFMGDLVIAEDVVHHQLPAMTGDFVGVVALGHSTEDVPARGADIDVYGNPRAVWHRDLV